MNDVGWEPRPAESGEQKSLRSHLLIALGYDARDPRALEEARKVADRALQNPTSVSPELAVGAVDLAALNGDQAFYEKLMAAVKGAKSPEQYYLYLFSLTRFSDAKLLERTLDYAISPDVRSQDALEVISAVMSNPAGEQLAWNFIQSQWGAVQKSGGHLPARKSSQPRIRSAPLACATKLRASMTRTKSQPQSALSVSQSRASTTVSI